MPKRAKRPCRYLGCPNLEEENGYCSEHKNQVKTAPNLHPERHALYGAEWRKRRMMHLARHPLCEDCLEKGIIVIAIDVHHEIRHEGNAELFFNSPLRSLCHSCHSKDTARETRERDPYWPIIEKRLTIPIYIVCGPPASGKTTFVRSRAGEKDIVIDLDYILMDITGKPLHSRVERSIVDRAIQIRNNNLEALQFVENIGQNGWFIVSAPTERERNIWRALLHPSRTYVLLCPEEECCHRIEQDPTRSQALSDLIQYVKTWWQKYEKSEEDEIIYTSAMGG